MHNKGGEYIVKPANGTAQGTLPMKNLGMMREVTSFTFYVSRITLWQTAVFPSTVNVYPTINKEQVWQPQTPIWPPTKKSLAMYTPAQK
jgi:hypothetical protein